VIHVHEQSASTAGRRRVKLNGNVTQEFMTTG
jgi:hypothetical protein